MFVGLAVGDAADEFRECLEAHVGPHRQLALPEASVDSINHHLRNCVFEVDLLVIGGDEPVPRVADERESEPTGMQAFQAANRYPALLTLRDCSGNRRVAGLGNPYVDQSLLGPEDNPQVTPELAYQCHRKVLSTNRHCVSLQPAVLMILELIFVTLADRTITSPS